MQINLPPGLPTNGFQIFLNGTLVNSMFAMRPNGRFQGIVTGLVDGDNLFSVRSSLGNAQIKITNHPIGGPVFAGAQLQPWSLPVVAETWDGTLNDINGFHVKPEHVMKALDGARGGAVADAPDGRSVH